MSTVTQLPVRDPTNAERQRRFRLRRQRPAVTPVTHNGEPTVTAISTSEMCRLAAKLRDGRVTLDDLRLADRLIMQLVLRLPPDSTIEIDAD